MLFKFGKYFHESFDIVNFPKYGIYLYMYRYYSIITELY